MACTGDKRDGVNELADGFGTRWVRNGSTLCETTGQRVGLKFREWSIKGDRGTVSCKEPTKTKVSKAPKRN